jgi:hypothetical protein
MISKFYSPQAYFDLPNRILLSQVAM